MNFSFIDHISAIDLDRAVGILRRDPGAAPLLPWLVVEAVGQLASWIAMQRTGFTRRPVAALVGEIRLSGAEARGSIELEAHITRLDARAILYGGSARCAGREIVAMARCVGPLMPMDLFDDPAAVGARFAALRGETPGTGCGAAAIEIADPEPSSIELSPGSAAGQLRIPSAAPFFADHFPRRPVYPASLLAAALSQLAAPLAAQTLGVAPAAVRLARLLDYKVRSFSPPGEQLELSAASRPAHDVAVAIDVGVTAGDRRVATGVLEYCLGSPP